jgi:hypothetical protein
MKTLSIRPFYHVRHDLQPNLTEELFVLLWDKSPCTVDALQKAAIERGYRLANRSPDQLVASLGNLRIVGHREHGEIFLTDLGKLISRTAKFNPSLLPELIHFTYYTIYDESNPSSRFSWAYRLVCDQLWNTRSSHINGHRLVTLVQEQAQQTFPDYEEYGISFSQNSVTGIIYWLEALNPPCVTQNQSGNRAFARRTFCSSELLLLALEYVRMKLGSSAAIQLQLSNEVRQAIARLCLVEEESLDDILQVTADAFELVLRQTERGNWISLLGTRSPLPLNAWFSFPVDVPAL